jgi:hypothetical protein
MVEPPWTHEALEMIAGRICTLQDRYGALFLIEHAKEDTCFLLAPGGLTLVRMPAQIAVGTAGQVQQESGPAARVDELGSSVFSLREHNENTRMLDAPPIFGSRKRSQTG